MEQQSFIQPSWKVGDYVTINGKHGKIIHFDATKNRVKVEHLDAESNKYDGFYRITDLPPYPVDDSDVSDTDEDEQLSVPDDVKNAPFGAEETANVVDTRGTDETLWFENGHKRSLMNGTTLTVLNPTTRGKWMCRVHVAEGGTHTSEKTAVQIAEFGHPAKDDATPQVPTVEEIVEAVKQLEAKVEEAPVPVAVDEPVSMRELMVEAIVLRDKDGFHAADASVRLTELVQQGWRESNVQLQTQYIPLVGKSYVETVAYYTFTRVVRCASEK